MIRSFRHRGLRALYEKRTAKRINPEHRQKLIDILGLLDAATSPAGLDLPGLRLHRLSGSMRDRYAVTVSGNWRVTFAFRDSDAVEVDYEDYH